jgi:hypothetical protein
MFAVAPAAMAMLANPMGFGFKFRSATNAGSGVVLSQYAAEPRL